MTQNGTVLVVDDDADVRGVLRIFLETQALQVLEAESGLVALKVLHTAAVDLIVSDLLMPNGNGLFLAGEAQKLGIPVIFITGYLDTYRSQIPEHILVVEKPPNLQELGRLVQAKLGKPRQSP
jgi:DNA-binding NtrC family response regulator